MDKEYIMKLIIRHCCELIPELKGREIKLSDTLEDLGANSMDRADIIMMSMEALALKIPRVELFRTKNIGGLVDVLYEKTKSSHLDTVGKSV